MAKLTEALSSGWDRIFDSDSSSSGPVASVKAAASFVAATVAQLAQALMDAEPGAQPPKDTKVSFL